MNISKLLAATDTTANPAKAPALATDGLADKTTFLKLLVSQIKNQNPLSPQDGSAFVAQLAQFSQVEQLVSIRQDLDSMKTVSSSGKTTP